jgi:uncharacterized protein
MSRYPSAAVALSGGVDSTLVLAAAKEVFSVDAVAVTVLTPYVPSWEKDDAREIAEILGVRRMTLHIPEIPADIRDNPPLRCYHCKLVIFREIKRAAGELGIETVFDGSNADEVLTHRPGLRALRELNIVSPLVECGIGKKDVRELLRMRSMPNAEKPSCSCLLTRLPYAALIETKVLSAIDRAETYLRSRGIRQCRVRVHGESARIEVAPEEREKLFSVPLLDDIDAYLKELGFRYAALDLSGYRSGKMDR